MDLALFLRALIALLITLLAMPAQAQSCEAKSAEPRPLWGDLHVHTALSLDAYAFGSIATPEDAYRFARGNPLTLDTGERVTIDRPLDFTAVTEHAATLDLMHICTAPGNSELAYCQTIRDLRQKRDPRTIFNDYLLPIVSLVPPARPEICADVDCDAARISQWQRIQDAANAANEPCEFTALIGYEWTPSPGGQHWHRNVIYRTQKVPDQVFDYVSYPKVGQLWQMLDRHCQPDDGCEAITIPHNINWADGGTFAVEDESAIQRNFRRQYEPLAEIHQEKGSSECLPADPEDNNADCAFERVTANAAKLRMSGPAANPATAWELARSSYYRSLLNRGIAVAAENGENPLMLGAIGSTDNHMGTPGHVAEKDFFGGMAMLWQPEVVRVKYLDFNPGGLVAVWADSNTREDIFDALKSRHAYATSGTRISLKFGVTPASACDLPAPEFTTRMGERIAGSPANVPTFTVLARKDTVPLARVDIITASLVDGQVVERTLPVAEFSDANRLGANSVCISWTDTDFNPAMPAYWYARVLEAPTPRWSKILCERMDNCAEHPKANREIQERAWSSPIWYQPDARL
jgi:hypothetical protein